MQRSHLRLVLGVLIAAVSLVIAGAAGGARTKAAAGSVTFGAEQEPPCLNGFTSGCNNTWTSWTAMIALAQLYIIKPNFQPAPYMATSAKVTRRSPFTVTLRINPKARWSDGKKVTAADVRFTWKTIVNPKWDIASRSGWDQVRSVTGLSGNRVRIVFIKSYAPWKAGMLGSYQILPAHALAGADFNSVWNNNYNDPKTGKTMADGPFKLQSYVKGQSLTMVRNPTFFGKRPSLDKITFVFRTDTNTEIQAIRGGEVDAIYPQPQLQLAALRGQSGLRVQTHAGTTIEHLDINTGAGNSNPLLGQRWFRQAIAYSIDRQAMVKQLFRTLNPGLPVLQNLTYTTNQRSLYKAHFQRYTHSIAKVTALMKAHKCTKASGIWSCGGTKASVRLGTTSGNKLRELAVEILQAQAKAAGIEFRPDSQPSRLFFPRIADKKYDIALFAWVSTGDPAGQTDIYGCGDPKTADNPTGAGGSNWKNYCNANVTRLFKASDQQLNPKLRAADVNGADAVLAQDVPSIPLYQKPTYFVFKTKLRGAVDDPTLQGPTWNTERWRVG
jgi:peptide/nickel transport system substrate-binding protein